LWDLEAGRDLGLLHRFDQSVHSLAFGPDGAWLAAACNDRRVALWDLSEPHQLPAAPDRFLTGHTGAVWSVGFSADGRYLASGSQQGFILLYDGTSFERVAALRSDIGEVRSLSFSDDNRFLAASAYAGGSPGERPWSTLQNYGPPTAVIWDLKKLRASLAEMGLDW
jgi:WD40 repeat protein